MKLIKKYLDEILIFFFIFCLPFQRRHIFFNISPLLKGQFSDFLAISLYISDLVAIILILRLIYLIHGKQAIFNRFWQIISIISIFFLYSIFVSRGIYQFKIYDFIKILEFIGIFGYFANISRKWVIISASLVITGIFQGFVGLLQFIQQKSLGLRFLGEVTLSRALYGIAKVDTSFGKYIRAYGTFAHANQLSAFLIVACATSLGLFFISGLLGRHKLSKLLLATTFTLIFLEFSTFSRAGLIALFASLAIILALAWFKRLQISEPTLVMLTAIIISILVYRPFLFPRLTISDQSTDQRLYYDKIGLDIIKAHPILGVGMGNITPETARAIGDYDQAWEIQPAHNYFFDIAIEFGILGLALILWFYFSLAQNLVNRLRATPKDPDQEQSREYIYRATLLSILVAVLILMQFDHYFFTLQQTQLLLWMILGMITAESFPRRIA